LIFTTKKRLKRGDDERMNALIGVFVVTVIVAVGFLIILVKDVFSKDGVDYSNEEYKALIKKKELRLKESNELFDAVLVEILENKRKEDERVQKESLGRAKEIMEAYREDPSSLADRFEKEFGIKVKK